MKRLFQFLVLLFAVSSIFAASGERSKRVEQTPGYTVNFENVSIIEFLKFVGKIGDINFIYKEEELDFNVTIVSEEQTSISNVMAALVQVLRINGFALIEDGPNLIIHRSDGGDQIATVVSPDLPLEDGETPPPLMTRVFRITNGNVSNIAKILRPLLSKGSVLEASEESRHLIITDVTANINRVQELLLTLDTAESPLDIDVYQAQATPVKQIVELAQQILTPISEGNPLIMVPQETTQSVFIVSTPALASKALSVCEDLDAGPSQVAQSLSGENILLYKLKNQDAVVVQDALSQVRNNLEEIGPTEEPLLDALKSMRYISSSNSLLFTGPPDVLKKVQEILDGVDTEGPAKVAGTTFFIYKIQNANEEQIAKSLSNLAENLEQAGDEHTALVDAIDSMQWVKESNSLIFTGEGSAIEKLKDIVPAFDVPPEESRTSLNQKPVNSDFFFYTPKHISGEKMIEELQNMVSDLKASGLADAGLISALQSAKWSETSDSILFTGSPEALEKVHHLLDTIDSSETGGPSKPSTFIYKPENISAQALMGVLTDLSQSLPEGNPLKQVLNSMRASQGAQTLVFTGPKQGIEDLKEVLPSFDNPHVNTKEKASHVIINLENISGDVVIKNLQRIAKTLTDAKDIDRSFIDTIDNIQWIQSTNSLYVSGPPSDIKRIRELVDQIDAERETTGSGNSRFFVYKPLALSAEAIVKLIKSMGDDLVASGLNNPELINTISSARATQNNTVVFTGNEQSIDEVQSLLQTIDTSKTQPSRTSFFVFKLQSVSGRQLISYLNGIANDLEKTGSADPNVLAAIRSARYIPDTRSVVFTGTQEALGKVEQMCERFDQEGNVEGTADRTAPSGYVIFHPKNLPGPELITVMKDFANNLTQSGVEDIELIDTIDNLKWMPKTNSILISGTPDAVERTDELLNRFDVAGMGETPTSDSMIDTIDDISFLIYKLQYHQGSELESALKKIAVDIQRVKGKNAESLINAIQAVQWLEVTNSLISTGPPETLTKLRELIHSIDVPLKQVFIEVLVLETDANNSLNLGLRWMSQGKYRDKLGWGGGASPAYTGSETDPFASYNTEFKSINATNTPTGTEIPLGSGFSLGVIGDLIFHKGNSYAALGSLVDALKVDGDISIVLNQKMVTQDGKQSTLFAGQNLPFQGSVVTNSQQNTLQTTNIEYRDIGVSLTITPRVGDNGNISMSIDQEITQNTNLNGDESSEFTVKLTGIATTKTNTQTQVTMPNNHFLVLSGSISDTKTRTRSSIPCLGGLPLIGAAFQRNETLTEKRNVIIFVRPQIIENFDVYKEITERQEEIHREQAVPEDYDAGLDLVKDEDNEPDFDF